MTNRRVLLLGMVGGLAAALLAACGGGGPEGGAGPPSGGVLATFAVGDEEFKVWVTNTTTIQQLRDLQTGKAAAGIPSGRILRGAGEGDHNAPWSWHLDPADIEMAELTMEVCDAQPSYVEANLDEFVGSVGRYCPWSADLVDLQDL